MHLSKSPQTRELIAGNEEPKNRENVGAGLENAQGVNFGYRYFARLTDHVNDLVLSLYSMSSIGD